MNRSIIFGLRKLKILGFLLGVVLGFHGSAKAATNTTFDVLVVTGSLTAVGSTTFQGSARFLSSSPSGDHFRLRQTIAQLLGTCGTSFQARLLIL